MSLDRRQKKRTKCLLERPDACRAAPESEDDASPQGPQDRSLHPAWPIMLADYDVLGLAILVRKDF